MKGAIEARLAALVAGFDELAHNVMRAELDALREGGAS